MSAKIVPLPLPSDGITAQEILQMKSFKDFTEEQAQELLEVVKSFCSIAYSIWDNKQKQIAGHRVVEIIPDTKQRAA